MWRPAPAARVTGRRVALAILLAAVLGGAGLWYAQVFAFYERRPEAEIRLTPSGGGGPAAIATTKLRAIDAASSPIRFRACFRVADPAAMEGRFARIDDPEPRNAPFWFPCFDAAAIAAALAEGRARAFLGEANITYGIDRVVAIGDDGRGFAWHRINRCGAAVFDGDLAPEGCPPPPDSNG